MKKVTVAGGGVLGSQIAFQCAYCGYDVTIWLRSQSSISRTQPKLDGVRDSYLAAIKNMEEGTDWSAGIADSQGFDAGACRDKVQAAYSSIKLELDWDKAFKGAYIVIESMAEIKDEKLTFYKKLAPYLDPDTILVTNSSTLLPSTFASSTGRADKYLSLHFANAIWKHNTAEVMAQEKTSDASFKTVMDFAQSIRMIALPVRKEKSGYLLNSLLVPFLLSGLDLYVNGVSDPAAIDTAWKAGTGAPKGPMEIFDVVGIQTAYNIVIQYQKVPGLLSPLLSRMMMPYNFKGMEKVLKKMLDEGKTGKSAGEGFYKYK